MPFDSAPQYQRATPDEAALAELWRTLRQPPELRSPEVNAAKAQVDALLSAYETFAADPNDTTYERAYTEAVASILNSLRATPAVPERRGDDAALLIRLAEKFDYESAGWSGQSCSPDLRRIAAYLSAVPDREALARALYIVFKEGITEERAARIWDNDIGSVERVHWTGEADRLVRVLGGFPAVLEQEPMAGFLTVEQLAERLAFVAQAFHVVAFHGINEAPDWKACKRPVCRAANVGFPVLVDDTPPLPAVLEKEPRAWEWSTPGPDGEMLFALTRSEAEADRWASEQEIAGTVTPLFAAAAPQVDTQTT